MVNNKLKNGLVGALAGLTIALSPSSALSSAHVDRIPSTLQKEIKVEAPCGITADKFYRSNPEVALAIDGLYGNHDNKLSILESDKFSKTKNSYGKNNLPVNGMNIVRIYDDKVEVVPGANLGGNNPCASCNAVLPVVVDSTNTATQKEPKSRGMSLTTPVLTSVTTSESKKNSKVKDLKKSSEKGLEFIFDFNGDGNDDRLSLTEDGKIKRDLGNDNIQYGSVDATRRTILEKLRFADKNGKFNRETATGYLLAQKPLDVLRFMSYTNDKATEVTGKRNDYELNKPTKIQSSVAWATFIDKIANMNSRGNILLDAMVEYNDDGLKVKENEDSRLAYSSTHAQKRTLSSIILNWGLGSAIYDTIQSDFRPLVEANAVLAKSIGANFNSNLRKLKTIGYDSTVLEECLDNTIKMYDDQLWAAGYKIGGKEE